MATRWRMPPDSSRGSDLLEALRPDELGELVRRGARRSRLSTPRSRSGSAMFSSTVYQGKRFASWKTRPSLRSASSSRRSPFHSGRPAMRHLAVVGWMRPARMRSIVVLPHPDCPTSATNSCLAIAEVDAGQREGLAVARAVALRDAAQLDLRLADGRHLSRSSGGPAFANRVRFVVSADISLLEKCATSAQTCASDCLPARTSVKPANVSARGRCGRVT